MIFALASALRLARFNAALDEEKPKWQSNYFTGMPTPAAAIVVMLPLYLHHVGIEAMKSPVMLNLALVYTLFVAFMMVSTIPTYSGKLLGERIGREWVLPIFIVAVAFVALLFSYPYEVLAMASLGYLATIPVSVRRYEVKKAEMPAAVPAAPVVDEGAAAVDVSSPPPTSSEATKPDAASPSGRVFPFRPNDPTRG
jgi:CDP-diacylglycerol--serine O-phosphatidyltransferase